MLAPLFLYFVLVLLLPVSLLAFFGLVPKMSGVVFEWVLRRFWGG